MKNQFRKIGLFTAFIGVFLFSGVSVFGQDAKECEKIAREIYKGVNERNADDLISYLAKDFNMLGFSGETAVDIFKALIVQLKDKVSDIQLVRENKTDNLTLVFKANWSNSGYEESSFVFDKNNKLVSLELLPTEVQER